MLYFFGKIWVDVVDYDVYAVVVDQFSCDGNVVLGLFDDISGWNFFVC